MIAVSLLACAMNVAPVTLNAIIHVESGGNPLTIHVNHAAEQPLPARTVQQAAATARRFIADGYSVDLGIMQINNRNLAVLGYTIEDALDACLGITGGAAILSADYGRAAMQFGEGQNALLAAISAYNTGDFARGFANGYVTHVAGIPALSLPLASRPNPYAASTVAYNREPLNVPIE